MLADFKLRPKTLLSGRNHDDNAYIILIIWIQIKQYRSDTYNYGVNERSKMKLVCKIFPKSFTAWRAQQMMARDMAHRSAILSSFSKKRIMVSVSAEIAIGYVHVNRMIPAPKNSTQKMKCPRTHPREPYLELTSHKINTSPFWPTTASSRDFLTSLTIDPVPGDTSALCCNHRSCTGEEEEEKIKSFHKTKFVCGAVLFYD